MTTTQVLSASSVMFAFALLAALEGAVRAEESARVNLAAALESAGAAPAAESVLEGRPHDSGDGAWQARRAAAVAAAEARLSREQDLEEAAARRLAPITPIDAPAEEEPDAVDLAGCEGEEDADLEVAVAAVIARRGVLKRGPRGLEREDLALLARAGYRPAVRRLAAVVCA